MRTLFVTLAILTIFPGPLPVPGIVAEAGAQDVEMLGRQHGTVPPAAYFEEIARDPTAFRFEREGADRLLHLQQHRGLRFPDLILRYGPAARSIGPRDVPMVGTFRYPLVLGLFSDTSSEPEYDHVRLQAEYFDGPNSYFQTIPELYHEMSGGRVQLEGVSFPWVRTDLTASEVTRGTSGLSAHSTEGVGAFIEQIVLALEAQGMDWTEFDNTGDGFVDVLTVMHPTSGAECTGASQQIWSHRWNVESATRGRLEDGIRTNTPREDGNGYIRINDYTIQPVLACRSTAINQIGVFAHELGHGFGLPDLYGTHGASHAGAGRWDLMGTGGWGCRGNDAARPCHMGAWSKATLGWVDVVDIHPDTDHGTITLPPVQSSHRVLRIGSVTGSGEFLLLENRQRTGFDVNLWEPGLLIWHVDQDRLDNTWHSNAVNYDPNRMGVWLRQADGLNLLASSGLSQGDPGDPFPGCIQDSAQDYLNATSCVRRNREFHAGTNPAARAHGGDPFGVTIQNIQLAGGNPADVRFDLSTRFTRVGLTIEGESEGSLEPFRVDGEPVADMLLGVPFDVRTIEAPAGAEIADGVRIGFGGWADGEPRIREYEIPATDVTLAVRYQGEELRLGWEPDGARGGVEPGYLETQPAAPDLWFPRGTEVAVEAKARTGFSFMGWTGLLAGASNPTVVRLDEPMTLTAGFDYLYRIAELPSAVELEGARLQNLLLSVEHGTAPIQWTVAEGTLPPGMTLAQSRIRGAPLEMGEFPVTIRARDASGLEAEVEIHLLVGPPEIGMDRLTGPFLGVDLGPTQAQRSFFDRLGNDNGMYDIGDLRAFLQAVPDVPDSTPPASQSATVSIQLRTTAPGDPVRVLVTREKEER